MAERAYGVHAKISGLPNFTHNVAVQYPDAVGYPALLRTKKSPDTNGLDGDRGKLTDELLELKAEAA